eukprot:1041170-Pelagomonas_calceolata.AAC.1
MAHFMTTDLYQAAKQDVACLMITDLNLKRQAQSKVCFMITDLYLKHQVRCIMLCKQVLVVGPTCPKPANALLRQVPELWTSPPVLNQMMRHYHECQLALYPSVCVLRGITPCEGVYHVVLSLPASVGGERPIARQSGRYLAFQPARMSDVLVKESSCKRGSQGNTWPSSQP